MAYDSSDYDSADGFTSSMDMGDAEEDDEEDEATDEEGISPEEKQRRLLDFLGSYRRPRDADIDAGASAAEVESEELTQAGKPLPKRSKQQPVVIWRSPPPDPNFEANTVITDKRTIFIFRVPANRPERMDSPPVTDAKGRVWRLWWFGQSQNSMDWNSVFLSLENLKELGPAAKESLVINFAILHRRDVVESLAREPLTHVFKEGTTDYGFPRFMRIISTLDREDTGELKYLDDEQCLRVSVVLEDGPPSSSLNLSFGNKSKAETGMVGLLNQGATCYMNSLLQTLYHLRQLRKAVYDMPSAAASDSEGGVAFALQKTFYMLQTSDHPVSTKHLTQSFGWDTYEAYMQQDVQELNRVLMDKLETIMKGTPVDGTVGALFEGSTRAYIRCTDVPYESRRDETFHDIQLDVKGCKTIHDSFARYIEEEVLDGEDKYDAGPVHGKQKAKKAVAVANGGSAVDVSHARLRPQAVHRSKGCYVTSIGSAGSGWKSSRSDVCDP